MIFRRKQKPKPANFDRASECAPEPLEPSTAARKVLLVDDDAVVLKALSMKFKAKGYRVIIARDSSEALSARRNEKPDVILLDVNFPPDIGGLDWNGFQLAEWFRRMEADRKVPTIVMSASDRADYQQQAAASGAAAFLSKPLDSEKLFGLIESALNQSGISKSSN